MDDVIALKNILLLVNSNYLDKLSIGSFKNTDIQKEHIIACHIYMRVLDYYKEAELRDILDRIEITYEQYEYTIFNVKKALQAANTNYYE